MINIVLEIIVLQIKQNYLLHPLPGLELFAYAAVSLWEDPLGYGVS